MANDFLVCAILWVPDLALKTKVKKIILPRPGILAGACSPCSWETETEASGIQGQLQL